MQEFKYVAKLDLKDAYYNIKLVNEIQKYLAFNYKGKNYTWTRLIQGISDGTTIFQRFLADILKDKKENVINYLDDIAIGANTMEELRRIYKEVIESLNKNGLKINWDKCYIPWNRKTGANILLGFAIRDDGFAIPKNQQEKIVKLAKTDPLKAAQILNYFRILSPTALRWFEKLATGKVYEATMRLLKEQLCTDWYIYRDKGTKVLRLKSQVS